MAGAAPLINCAPHSTEEEDDSSPTSEDAITGVHNSLGLALVYDATTGHAQATVKEALGPKDRLFLRVRRGVITHESQKNLDCNALSEAPILDKGAHLATGKTIYKGPKVDPSLITLLGIYDDERWYGGHETAAMDAELAKGSDAIVEACIMRDGKPRAKLLTNLAYAWDRGKELDAAEKRIGSQGLSFRSGDAGLGDGGADEDAGAGPQPGAPLQEGNALNTIDYANLCVQELGEIPFFKKLGDGKYESFDCRDFAGSNGEGAAAPVEGVQGTSIPLTVNDQPKETCDNGSHSERSYDCVDKCDKGMFLTASSHTGLGQKASCQPGVTVTTAKNDKGSHWVLLCRKVEDTGPGMMKTKRFNDIAIIGTNPNTGKTCFFQNKENIGNDGSRVVHPADVDKSSAIWPATPSSYCTKSCHAADAFVHSPWIDGALRSDGHPIVPKMGEHQDFPVSDLGRPYSILNGPAQGFELPQQLVSEKVEACTTCHRVAGAGFSEFALWSTGKGDNYYNKITDSYKSFEKTHWMPQRLDGLSADNFDASRFGIAVQHMNECLNGNPGPDCEFAPIPAKR